MNEIENINNPSNFDGPELKLNIRTKDGIITFHCHEKKLFQSGYFESFINFQKIANPRNTSDYDVDWRNEDSMVVSIVINTLCHQSRHFGPFENTELLDTNMIEPNIYELYWMLNKAEEFYKLFNQYSEQKMAELIYGILNLLDLLFLNENLLDRYYQSTYQFITLSRFSGPMIMKIAEKIVTSKTTKLKYKYGLLSLNGDEQYNQLESLSLISKKLNFFPQSFYTYPKFNYSEYNAIIQTDEFNDIILLYQNNAIRFQFQYLEDGHGILEDESNTLVQVKISLSLNLLKRIDIPQSNYYTTRSTLTAMFSPIFNTLDGNVYNQVYTGINQPILKKSFNNTIEYEFEIDNPDIADDNIIFPPCKNNERMCNVFSLKLGENEDDIPRFRLEFIGTESLLTDITVSCLYKYIIVNNTLNENSIHYSSVLRNITIANIKPLLDLLKIPPSEIILHR